MKRSLTDFELSEIRKVFQDSIRYPEVWILEGRQWTNTIDQVGAWIRGDKPSLNNAITLGNRVYFPIPLQTSEDIFHSGQIGHFAWLMHEMTHVWQYQQIGWVYFVQALWGQIWMGKAVYDYGGEQGLLEARAVEKSFRSFNPEQQGDIVRDFYIRSSRGLDTSAWQPFIAELTLSE